MNILVVSYYFYPSSAVGARRIVNLVKFLQTAGHNVSVLTVKPEYYSSVDTSLNFEGDNVIRTRVNQITVNSRDLKETLLSGMQRRFNYFFKRLLGHFLFPDDMAGWVGPALREGSHLCEKMQYQFIIASGTPWTSFVIGRKLSAKYDVPLILDYRDPWAINRGQSANYFIHFMSKVFEKQLMAFAHHIVVNTESARQSYIEHYPALSPAKISVVRNGYDESLLSHIPKIQHPNEREPFTLIHTGLFYQSRRLEPLIRAVAQLVEERNEVRALFRVMCYGPLLAADRDLVKKLSLEDVIQEKRFVSYADSLRELARSSMTLLIVGAGHASMVPAKLFDYFMLGRPIFCIGPQNSEAQMLIQRHRFGMCCEPEVTSIKNSLVAALEGQSKGLLKPIEKPKEYSVENQFSLLNKILTQTETGGSN